MRPTTITTTAYPTLSWTVIVYLAPGITGRVQIKNLSDRYVTNIEEEFPVGKLVTGRILSVNMPKKQLDLSLRPSSLIDTQNQVKLNDLKVRPMFLYRYISYSY